MRARTVVALEVGAFAIGVLGEVILFQTAAGDYAFGLCGIAVAVLAALAMIRRSWARVPLAALALCGVWLAAAGFSTTDDPSEIAGFAYLYFSGFVIIAAVLSAFVTIAEADLKRPKLS
ncbi:hypothetical protein [Aeromicrobium sp.]|uniref:hypothetical protein n=1 Tax=Aeromicrobium sp. TaxID=1871063 RepID=UPI002FC98872